MNHVVRRLRMRKTIILSVLLLSLSAGLWAQFWEDYTNKQRETVGEAYWLAGQQYQAIGKTEKGSQYMAVAKQIYPQLDPAMIADQALPSATELLARGGTTEIGSGAAGVPAGAISSFFLRFVGTLLDKDADAVVEFLDGSVYLSGLSAEVTREEARPALAAFFKDAPLEELQPSAVYDLESVVVSGTSAAMHAVWGEAYVLTVNAKVDYSEHVGFWEMKQRFFIRRVSGNWYLFAYGRTPPPLTWAPQGASPSPEKAPAVAQIAEASASIAEAFKACMSSLLTEDAEGALVHMSPSIRFLRLRQSVTKEELKTTLQGYFETTDFASASTEDVVDLDSVFVEPSTSPVEGVAGDVYMLNVKAKVDLSGSIPFWSSFQRYYFINVSGNWVIFAIL
jgi:hypothetical protein